MRSDISYRLRIGGWEHDDQDNKDDRYDAIGAYIYLSTIHYIQ